ncbi:hypothetical protein SAMN05192561_105154 [Halopenitus malekzadehii]|uniref:IclR helix-turn-helix domain-containing protein n=1 Tax=Halopenitus malekzadehii TaxID=1267564 RepID=A0A1H6J201_9EURY|nr:hypothetical protein [Halopenitus malekzadehii]SEH54188.1 hypothetical protein SAMN05192561_105154 [Halopenitus malekzadehii]
MPNSFNTIHVQDWVPEHPSLEHTMPSQKSPIDSVENLSMDELRDEYPSGWRILVQNESVGYILDALMDALPGSEFTKSELADKSGVSRQSVYSHLDLLLVLEVLEPVEDSSPERYRVNVDDELLELLHQVNGIVNERLAD